MTKPAKTRAASPAATADYSSLVGGVGELLDAARRASVRTVNAFMTATYWEVGRRIVEFEQGGEKRAGYGDTLLEPLATDLTARFGRGFARPNLVRFRQFYHAFPTPAIRPTLSNESGEATIVPAPPARFDRADLARAFPLCGKSPRLGPTSRL